MEHLSTDMGGRSKDLTQTFEYLGFHSGCSLLPQTQPTSLTDCQYSLPIVLEDHVWVMSLCQGGHGCVPPVLPVPTRTWGPVCAFKGFALPSRKT